MKGATPNAACPAPRYAYLGDGLTDPRFVGQPCDPVDRAEFGLLKGVAVALGPSLVLWWLGYRIARVLWVLIGVGQ